MKPWRCMTFHKHFHFLEFGGMLESPLPSAGHQRGAEGNRFDRQEVHILSGSLIMLVSERKAAERKEGNLPCRDLSLPKYSFFASSFLFR